MHIYTFIFIYNNVSGPRGSRAFAGRRCLQLLRFLPLLRPWYLIHVTDLPNVTDHVPSRSWYLFQVTSTALERSWYLCNVTNPVLERSWHLRPRHVSCPRMIQALAVRSSSLGPRCAPATLPDAATLLILPLQRSSNAPGRCNAPDSGPRPRRGWGRAGDEAR